MAETGQPRSDNGGGSRPGGSGSSRRRRRGGRGRGQGQGQRPNAGAAQSARQNQSAAARPRGQTRGQKSGQRQRTSFVEGIPAAPAAQGRRHRPPNLGGGPSHVVPPAEPLVAEDEVRVHRRRAEVLAGLGAVAPAVVVGLVLGLVVSAVAGVVAFVVVLVLGTLAILRLAVPVTLRLVGARPLGEDELPRLQNLVDGLCPTFGVRPPRLMAVDDPLPNACSVATRPNHGTLVVTTGLESALDLIEMEGVLSHELAHLKRSDAVVSGVAVAVLAPITWMTGSDRLLHRVVGRGREWRADMVAVRAVRYPPGLHDALVRFSGVAAPSGDSLFGGRRFAMSRWIWVDPSVGDRESRQPGDLDGTAVRIDALSEL